MYRKSTLLALFLAGVVYAGDPPVPPGHVLLRVRDADLGSEVLPRIAARAGVRIDCEVPARKVTLLLNQAVPWEEALDLACRFARAHPVRTSDGRIVVRAKFGGQLGADRFDDLHGKADPDAMDVLRERTAQVEARRAREAAPWNAQLRRRWAEFMAEMDRKFSLGPNAGFAWRGGNLRGQYTVGVVPRGPDGPTGVVPTGVVPAGSNHQAVRTPGVVPRGPSGPTGSTLQGTVPRGPNGPTGVVPRTDLPRGPDGPTGNTLTNGRAGQR